MFERANPVRLRPDDANGWIPAAHRGFASRCSGPARHGDRRGRYRVNSHSCPGFARHSGNARQNRRGRSSAPPYPRAARCVCPACWVANGAGLVAPNAANHPLRKRLTRCKRIQPKRSEWRQLRTGAVERKLPLRARRRGFPSLVGPGGQSSNSALGTDRLRALRRPRRLGQLRGSPWDTLMARGGCICSWL